MMLRLALLELRHARAKLIGVFFILTVGFIGPLLSSALSSSVETYVTSRSRQILSADLAVSALREFKPDEIETLRHVTSSMRESREVEFLTMAKGKTSSSLIEVRGVDSQFPVFGEFQFKDGTRALSAQALSASDIAWAFPEVLAQLGLDVGDDVEVGRARFKIAAVITDGPGTTRGLGIAPRLYISLAKVQSTGLTQFGSQVYHKIYFELPKSISSESASARVKATLADPDIFLRTPADSTASLERFFSFYRLYLVAVSMIVFALSWVSAFYILQVFLQERLKNGGIVMTFGASRESAALISLLQVSLVMIASLLLASVVVFGLMELAPSFVGDRLPNGFIFRLAFTDFAKLLSITLISALAFAMPSAIRLRVNSVQDLLSESAGGASRLTRTQGILAYGPLALVFLLLSVWLMNSVVQALQLSGGVFVALLIGWSVARLVFRSLFGAMKTREGFARLISMQLVRGRFGVNLCFITLMLGSMVLNLVPHLLKSAVAEIEPIQGRDVPALFLFNIPEAAVSGLPAFASARGAEVHFLSPMILGRLMKRNGEAITNDQLLRFPVRLSYREGLIGSEQIVAGRAFSGAYDASKSDLPEMTVEASYAERNDFKLDDVLEFDVQGVPVSGRVVSLRKVKWTEFNPNFFMIFQPGVLDDAPKTFVASVTVQATALDERESVRTKLQYDFVHDYPDMNVIDVGRAIERALDVAKSILGPVRVAAGIAVGMSFLVLLGVIAHNLRLRTREIEIDKLLGADASLIRQLISAEYFVLALSASVFGAVFATGIAMLVSWRILDVPLRLDVSALTLSILVTTTVATLIANFSARRVLGLRGTTRRL